jgi:hypothetical protein
MRPSVGGFPLISSTNKTDCHNIAEILLKVALDTIAPTLTCIISFSEMGL